MLPKEASKESPAKIPILVCDELLSLSSSFLHCIGQFPKSQSLIIFWTWLISNSIPWAVKLMSISFHHLLTCSRLSEKMGTNPYCKPWFRTLWVQSAEQFKLNMASLNLLFPPHLLRAICAEPLTTWEQFMERSLLKIAILINNFLPSISVFAVWSVAFSRPFS